MRAALTLLAAVVVAAPGAAQTAVSERAALHLSLWGTVIPVAAGAVLWASQKGATPGDPFSGAERSGPSLLIAGGFVVGPSFGYGAAGLGGRGLRGVGLRAGLTLLSFVPAFAICGWDCSKGDAEYDLAWLAIATGAGLSAASAIYDIARVQHNVRGRDAHRARELSVAPWYVPGQRGGALGVRFGVTF